MVIVLDDILFGIEWCGGMNFLSTLSLYLVGLLGNEEIPARKIASSKQADRHLNFLSKFCVWSVDEE